MAQSDELTQRLFEAVDTIIGERISSLPYDQTIVCKIVDATDKANGIYIVSHDFDTTFTAYADFTGFEVGDDVYVRIPEGDYTKQKVITGKYLEGLLIAGETQNISITGNESFLLYDKNNQIHTYEWSKIERELQFSYYNTANETQTWKEVLNTFANYSMDYERANAIKLIIGSEDDIVVYFYKYKDGTEFVTNEDGKTIQQNTYSFAAEQYGVTAQGFIPDISQTTGFVKLDKSLLYVAVNRTTMTYNKLIRYYQKDNSGNYIWINTPDSGLEDFNEYTQYYIPSNVAFYQSDSITDSNRLDFKTTDGFTAINVNPTIIVNEEEVLADVQIFDDTKDIWYWVPGRIDLDVSSIPMLKSAYIYYDEEEKFDEETGARLSSATGMFHLKYTIAPELTPEHAVVPISIQYCPSGETTNIRAQTSLNFGYITELDDEINIDLYLKRTLDGVKETVPAITVGGPGEYQLEIMLTNKYGDKISNNIFSYKWDGNTPERTGIYSINTVSSMPTGPKCIKLEIGFTENENFVTYRTYYYPLAYRSNDMYFIESPTTIIYNEAGVNPVYYDGIIKLQEYNNPGTLEQIIETPENNDLYTIINNQIMGVYNFYKGYDESSYLQIKVDNQIVWLQSLYFTKKKPQGYIQVKNFPEQNSIVGRSFGALAAQSSGNSGMILSYNKDSVLALDGYNYDHSSAAPIFHLDSIGTLQVGYKDFTMTGHISEGARYLESNRDEKYTIGNQYQPIYFNNGIPAEIGTAILNSSAVEADESAFGYKIVPELATSRILSVSGDYTIQDENNGQFIILTNSGTITLNSGVHLGTEFELMWFGSNGSAKFSASDTTIITVDNGSGTTSATISEKGGIAAVKYLGNIGSNGPYWVITGTID